MKLTKKQFDDLYNLYKDDKYNIENKNLKFFEKNKIIIDCKITEYGLHILDNYKVKNGIIMAAGLSSRFAPLSYEKPKGLAMVHGEVIIERLIKQLKEKGIDEIVVVIGNMPEKFIYLKDKYNVKFVFNNDYKIRNTHSSLFFARDYIGNSYICCSDNYYPKNPFNSHEFYSYTSALYVNDIMEGERGVFTNKNDLIIRTQRPAKNQYIMLGFQYFDNKFSKKFIPILEDYYHREDTCDMYWEQVYAKNVKKLKLYTRKFQWEDILEFDTVTELEKYDKNYLQYNNYKFINNICNTLNCLPSEIEKLVPISKGLTNMSFSFEVNNIKYVYRMPGTNSPDKIDRKLEKINQEFAKEIGIDDSYIYEDENEGWKISKFIDTNEQFNFKNFDHIKLLCDALKKLNNSNFKCGKNFDYINKINKILGKIKDIEISVYEKLMIDYKNIIKIDEMLKKDNWNIQLSHNDIWEENLLLDNNKLHLIDWEYAGDTDIGYDISKICVRSECSFEDIPIYLQYYFGRKPSKEEINHLIGCVVVSYYYWLSWANYMQLVRNNYDSYIKRYKKIFNMYYNEYLKIFKEEF